MANRLLLQPTDMSQWHTVVNEAQHQLAITLPEAVESYLVFMLMRFTDAPDCLNSLVGHDYLLLHHGDGVERKTRLRDVGDKCLLFAGFFPGQAQRRHVKLSYFVRLGQSAYLSLAHMNVATPDVFAQLSQEFIDMMDVMQTIRSDSDPQTLITPTDALELWSSYESKVSEQVLNELDGDVMKNMLRRRF